MDRNASEGAFDGALATKVEQLPLNFTMLEDTFFFSITSSSDDSIHLHLQPTWRATDTMKKLTMIISLILLFFLATASGRFNDGSLFWRKSISLIRPYQAPLLECDYPRVIEGSYCVFLHLDSSLENHQHTVNQRKEFDWNITHTFPEYKGTSFDYGTYYCAEDIDHMALDAIRADVMVDQVTCERWVSLEYDGELVEDMEDDVVPQAGQPSMEL